MADFGLVKSFDIDHGELDGFSAQGCFVLGYELAQIDEALQRGDAVSKPIHAANAGRIRKSCQGAGVSCTLTWHPDDRSESWMQLDVEASNGLESQS